MSTWSHDATFYFLALAEQFRTLWDSRRDDHYRCPKKEWLRQNICKRMSQRHPVHEPYNVEMLKTAFANKRWSYRKYKKKGEKRKSGQAQEAPDAPSR
ncbi:uncharacterized protein LOC142584205 isoform X2 [Dermacentor variabilis]|uniref:uncharacterized protein LOC142584205 isoform X2 n=1 Tax=Dermacentor variabilis TaxID=34621 RepID=UPI003F5B8155